jgi:2'-5' RNA ligase
MRSSAGLAITRRIKPLLNDLPLLGGFFSSRLGRNLRKRLYQVQAAEVRRVATALDGADVTWFLGGGWGVDALVGRRTRYHGDLDLCIEVAIDGEAKAVEVLRSLGYDVTVPRAPSGHRFPFRSVLRDRSGRTVDLIFITCLDASPTEEDVPKLGTDDYSTGQVVVEGRPVQVPCLSPSFQLALHTGYIPQKDDRQDVAVLCETFGLPAPPAYSRTQPPPSLGKRAHDCAWEIVARIRGISAVVVLVPDADDILDAVGSSKSGGMPAHVTVLYPFVSPRRIRQSHCEQLEAIAARTEPFTLELAELDHHELITFLTVHPEEPLRRLTTAVLDSWPEHPPYGDDEFDVPPHLTLGYDVLPDEIADSAEPLLPIESEIDRLVLMLRGLSGRWRVAHEFPLGEGTG